MASAQIPGRTEVIYPDSDGMPMADNTRQWEWIATIKGGVDALFRDDPNVFVAGDLLWYPVEGDNKTRTAPDVLVAFGRPKGYRGSYRQWEEDDVVPQVVFEVLSPGNRPGEMVKKFRFYEKFGVEEYYVFDPDDMALEGWLRTDGGLEEIPAMDGWVSPRLGVRFDLADGDLRLSGPDGRPFSTYIEIANQRDRFERQLSEVERQRDEAERQRDEERRRAERLAARLKALGEEAE